MSGLGKMRGVVEVQRFTATAPAFAEGASVIVPPVVGVTVPAFAENAFTSVDDAAPDMAGEGAVCATATQAGEQGLNGFSLDICVLVHMPINIHTCPHLCQLTKCFVKMYAAMTSEIQS